MPKKFGINIKGLEARESKKQAKEQKLESKLRVEEDILWMYNSNEFEIKEARKNLLEEKKMNEKMRKKENQRLADDEIRKLEISNNPEIEYNKNKNNDEEKKIDSHDIDNEKKELKKKLKNIDKDINPNHIYREEQARLGEEGNNLIKESNFGDGNNLEGEQKMFKHPEKKRKQAWINYKKKYYSVILKENPYLRGSQVIQILFNNFQRAAENPFNQNWVEYNTKLG